MANAVNFKFDMREMDEALSRLNIVSDKLPSELVNQKGWRIFQKATWFMKSTEAGKIAGELGAGNTLTLLKSGKRKGQYRQKKVANFFGQGDTRDYPGVPLLAIIASKRKGGSPWRGVTREEGAKNMFDAMKKIYGARQKSRGYFKACFATIRDVFKKSQGKLQFSDPLSKGAGTIASNKRDAGRIADATPAKKGSSMAESRFWIISPRHDVKDALDRIAAPQLQRAIDEETGETFAHAAEKEYKEAIAALGIKVT